MSVALTKEAVYARRKTVSRRAGWTFLVVGEVVTLCEKVQGRRRGDPLVRICDVEIVSVRRERLDAVTDEDVYREGFTDDDFRRDPETGKPAIYADAVTGEPGKLSSWKPKWWFVAFYCSHMRRVRPSDIVTRIEWRYLDE